MTIRNRRYYRQRARRHLRRYQSLRRRFPTDRLLRRYYDTKYQYFKLRQAKWGKQWRDYAQKYDYYDPKRRYFYSKYWKYGPKQWSQFRLNRRIQNIRSDRTLGSQIAGSQQLERPVQPGTFYWGDKFRPVRPVPKPSLWPGLLPLESQIPDMVPYVNYYDPSLFKYMHPWKRDPVGEPYNEPRARDALKDVLKTIIDPLIIHQRYIQYGDLKVRGEIIERPPWKWDIPGNISWKARLKIIREVQKLINDPPIYRDQPPNTNTPRPKRGCYEEIWNPKTRTFQTVPCWQAKILRQQTFRKHPWTGRKQWRPYRRMGFAYSKRFSQRSPRDRRDTYYSRM